MEQSDFNGLSQASGRRLVLINDQHKQLLTVEGRPYLQWALDDVLTKRIAIVQLHELNIGSQEEIAAAFGISAKSVHKYIKRFAAKGSAGLVGDKKGPKSQWKINAEVRGKILYTFLKERIVEYKKIKVRLESWGEEVGISSIRQVLLENGLVQEVPAVPDLENPRELFHTEEDKQQLMFDFPWAEGGGQGTVDSKRNEGNAPPATGKQKRGRGVCPG